MKISELPKEIREKALKYQKNEKKLGYDKNTDNLSDAFCWGSTEEGVFYWSDWNIKTPTQEPLKTLEELQPLIIEWARDKDLIHSENSPKQRLKLIEEAGELSSAILKNDIEKQKDAIGDIFVVLVIYAEQINGSYASFYWGSEYNRFEGFEICDLISNAITYEDEIDSLFWMHAVCHKLNIDLTECANLAWNEIKDRTGKTVNGTFIKN